MKVSIELLDDSAFDLEEYIAREFAYAFGAAEERSFCVGTGTGQPTGLFTANGGTVGVTAASATTVTTDEVISLIYALKAPYRKNAKFLMNDATVSALRKLKDSNGQYLWQPSLQAGQPDRLLGYEDLHQPVCSPLAAGALSIAFGDFQAIGSLTARQNRSASERAVFHQRSHKEAAVMDELLSKVKANLILEHTADDALLKSYITAAVSYAESYQHIPEGFYKENPMPATTEQAVIMLSSHFYESRDGSTGGFFADNTGAAQQVWNTVNLLLRLDRRWQV